MKHIATYETFIKMESSVVFLKFLKQQQKKVKDS